MNPDLSGRGASWKFHCVDATSKNSPARKRNLQDRVSVDRVNQTALCLREAGLKKAKRACSLSPPSGALPRIGAVAYEERSGRRRLTNETKLVFSADYKMAEVYHKSDIAKFLESIGKKVDSSDREPKYMQSSSWRYMDDKQKP